MVPTESVDVLIIGGGINGTGIARDAAGRGLSVLLCEQGDLAGGTSSASSKLIHGGLRYLEHFKFRLVREALAEREVLLANAPHLIHPLTFVLPHDPSLRHWWKIRLGLFIYDHLGRRRRLAGSHSIRLQDHPAGAPLKPAYERGFTYTDCRTDDARLVILTARDAANRGASILTRTRCNGAQRDSGSWLATLQPMPRGEPYTVRARVVVNAAGPWMKAHLPTEFQPARQGVRLVKGSHLVLPRLYEGGHAYLLQNDDRRVVFVIPFFGEFSLIGTTDTPFEGDPASASVDDAEAEYLCAVVNRYFSRAIKPADAVWRFAGVRHLADEGPDNPAVASREYVLPRERKDGAPLLSVIGGKLTGYREVAAHAMGRIKRYFPGLPRRWTANAILPGGDMPDADFGRFCESFREAYPWLPEALALRLAAAYGTLAHTVIGGAGSLDDLGRHFGVGLYERELRYLVSQEWARTAEDILWRRTKLGLHFTSRETGALSAWMDEHTQENSTR